MDVIEKRLAARISPGELTSTSKKAKTRIAAHIHKVFQRQKDRAKEKAGELKKGAVSGTASSALLRKDSTEDETYNAIIAAVDGEWAVLPVQIASGLSSAMLSGIGSGTLQIDFADDSLIAAANDIASTFAQSRSAELVGRKYDDEGNLVENPDAKWAISDTTRNKIRAIVTQAFQQETKLSDVSAAIQTALEDDDAGIFTEARADMIATTEVANAQTQGNFRVWKQSGIVTKVDWLLSDDHDEDDVCDDMADGAPYDIDDCPLPGLDTHPRCHCALAVAELSDSE